MKTVLTGLLTFVISASALAFNIYDHDNRVPMLSDEYPWSAVGRLTSSPDAQGRVDICTATLVSNDVILTAAHCFFDSGVVKHGDFFFQPTLKNGSATVTAHVVSLVYDSRYPTLPKDEAIAHDWALAKLDQDLGSSRGTIAIYEADPFLLSDLATTQNAITLAGYSGDYMQARTATISANCSVRKSGMGSVIFHDCNMTPGASGAALLVKTRDAKWYVVGVNVAERLDSDGHPYTGVPYSDANANIAVSATEFYGQWKKLVDGSLPENYTNNDTPIVWTKVSQEYSLQAWATKACSMSPKKVIDACRAKAEEFVTKNAMPLGADALVAYRAGMILSVCQVPDQSNSGVFGPLWAIERRLCFSRATGASDSPFQAIHKLCWRGDYTCYVHELENVTKQVR